MFFKKISSFNQFQSVIFSQNRVFSFKLSIFSKTFWINYKEIIGIVSDNIQYYF